MIVFAHSAAHDEARLQDVTGYDTLKKETRRDDTIGSDTRCSNTGENRNHGSAHDEARLQNVTM